MSTEPTDDHAEQRARDLLARAAGTIEVDPSASMTLTGLPEPPQRRWPVLAAAAAVVVAIGGGVVVAQQVGGEPATPTADPSVASDGPADEPSLPGDDDRLPSLIGYTEDEAVALLQERGYPVEVRVVPDGCNLEGVVTGTRPDAGTPVVPGTSAVTLRVVGRQDVIDCVGEVPWGLIWTAVRESRGLEPLYDEAPEIEVPEDVASAVEAMLATPWPGGGVAEVVARYPYVDDLCWPDPGRDFGARFWVAGPVDGQFCPAVSAVILGGDGEPFTVRVDGDPLPEHSYGGLTGTQQAAAETFVAWAKGEGPAPAFAPSVRLLLHGSEMATIEDPAQRASWIMQCPRFMSAPCPQGAVEALRESVGDVALSTERAHGCGARPGLSPEDLKAAAATDLVRIDEPEPKDCSEQWSVELWIDEAGVIYAANATVPRW
ncbi:PASTA domain-containing protein [Nocardioides stalactiti]|uniref:PASTA domain-containing protein n=1 Tax=Nocardioides stalactiti TaxID=2755356 RepID=UPI0016046D5F|nr:PASTA domain-containing protein [Nocardioides stalactiti]